MSVWLSSMSANLMADLIAITLAYAVGRRLLERRTASEISVTYLGIHDLDNSPEFGRAYRVAFVIYNGSRERISQVSVSQESVEYHPLKMPGMYVDGAPSHDGWHRSMYQMPLLCLTHVQGDPGRDAIVLEPGESARAVARILSEDTLTFSYITARGNFHEYDIMPTRILKSRWRRTKRRLGIDRVQ